MTCNLVNIKKMKFMQQQIRYHRLSKPTRATEQKDYSEHIYPCIKINI